MSFRQIQLRIDEDNRQWPKCLKLIPKEFWPLPYAYNVIAVLRSQHFLVQVYQEANEIIRLSVCRTNIVPADNAEGWRFEEGISWEELQRCKSEAGFAERDAVEVYPPDRDVVNVSNMRHLWVLPNRLPFVWRTPEEHGETKG